MIKKPWEAFAHATSQSHVAGLVDGASHVPPEELVDMQRHRRDERMLACGGRDPVQVLVAYAQDSLAYSEDGALIEVKDRADYLALKRKDKLNKFGLAYRPDAKFWLHRTLADIVVGAAVHLWQSQGWSLTLYDGLRTVEGAYNLYLYAPMSDMESGLLSLPGQSAHNKGMAVDSMCYGDDGREVDMGAHFDHLDMTVNSRVYAGPAISAAAIENRRLREAAFLRAAFAAGRLIAPLRTEFWDDRLPENREDLWRVLDSAARVVGLALLSPEDIALRRNNRPAFAKKWEQWSYGDFLVRWKNFFAGREDALEKAIGTATPPLEEKPEFYHGNFHPIYDRDLAACGRNITEPA